VAAGGFDFSEVDRLAADLGEVPDNIGPYLNSAVQHTGFRVKKGAAKRVSGSRSWRAAAQAIDYDVKTLQAFGVSQIQVDIGYDKDKPAGALGNLREYGAPDSPTGPLGPHNDLAAALHDEEKDFGYGIAKAAEDAERKAGL
jgi:hypothetical protein